MDINAHCVFQKSLSDLKRIISIYLGHEDGCVWFLSRTKDKCPCDRDLPNGYISMRENYLKAVRARIAEVNRHKTDSTEPDMTLEDALKLAPKKLTTQTPSPPPAVTVVKAASQRVRVVKPSNVAFRRKGSRSTRR